MTVPKNSQLAQFRDTFSAKSLQQTKLSENIASRTIESNLISHLLNMIDWIQDV